MKEIIAACIFGALCGALLATQFLDMKLLWGSL